MRVSEHYGSISSLFTLESYKSSFREYWSHQFQSENFKSLTGNTTQVWERYKKAVYTWWLQLSLNWDREWYKLVRNLEQSFEVNRKLCFNLQKWYGLNLYRSRSPSVQSIPVNEFSSTEHEFRLEESFTVLLGKYNTSLS